MPAWVSRDHFLYVVSGFSRIRFSDVVSAFRRTVIVTDVVSAFKRTVIVTDVVSGVSRTRGWIEPRTRPNITSTSSRNIVIDNN